MLMLGFESLCLSTQFVIFLRLKRVITSACVCWRRVVSLARAGFLEFGFCFGL